MFSGKLDKGSGKRHWDPPLQGEFSNVHKSIKKKNLDVKHLHGFKDVADTVVYEAVKLKFERMVGGERCYKYVTVEERTAQKEDDEGNVCAPMSCSDLGKQVSGILL